MPGGKDAGPYERLAVRSRLGGPNGERAELSIAVSSQDGEMRGINFWDLDKTLLLAEPIHAKAVDQIFPAFAESRESRDELHKVYFNGFALGNSFREWDRMWRIYGEGQNQYKDVRVYETEFMGNDNPKQKLIDEPGHGEGYHERANEILQRYGRIAYDVMRKEYEKDPEEFQKGFLKPEMLQLLIEKSRLGQASVYMTANQKDFARGLVAFSGLYKYGLALATDETMAGGGKEVAIRNLIKELGDMGLRVNKKRAAAIGDSIKGDVGSGAREELGSGVLVVEATDDPNAIMARAKGNNPDGEQLRAIFEQTNVEAIPTEEVGKSKHGVYRFGKRSSQAEQE